MGGGASSLCTSAGVRNAADLGTIWGAHDPVECWFVTFKTFYDASGTQNDGSDTLMLVGLVATERKWLRFEEQWQEALEWAGIPYFRMVEFHHAHGAFEGWHGKHDKRAHLLGRLIEVLKLNINKMFAVGVDLGAFNRVNNEYALAEAFGSGMPDSGAFAYVAGNTKALITEWMAEKHPHENILHVFEAGDAGRGAFETFVQQNEWGSARNVSFLSKQNADGSYVRPFEGADLAAWEYRKFGNTQIADTGIPERKSLYDLANGIPQETYLVADESVLRALCEDKESGIMRR